MNGDCESVSPFCPPVLKTRSSHRWPAWALGVSLLLSAFARTGRGEATHFRDLAADQLPSRKGSLRLRLRFLKDVSSEPQNRVSLLAVSSDGKERYEIVLIGHDLIARRYFSGCFLTALIHPYDFATGQWAKLELSWNQASTRLTIDGREVTDKKFVSTKDLGSQVPGVRLGSGSDFETDGWETSSESPVWPDPADQEVVARTACPNLSALLAEPAQDVHRGVELHPCGLYGRCAGAKKRRGRADGRPDDDNILEGVLLR